MYETKRHDKIVSRYDGSCGDQRRRLLTNSEWENDGNGVGEISSDKNIYGIRKWLVCILACLLVSLIAINTFTYEQLKAIRFGRGSNEVSDIANEPRASTVRIIPGFVVHTAGCRIPSFEVVDANIEHFFAPEKPIVCNAGINLPLVDSNLTAIYVDPEAKPRYYNASERVACCYRPFRRAENSDNVLTYDKQCQIFNDSGQVVEAEFVKIECRKNGKQIYEDYHAFVPRKSLVEERCQNASRNFVNRRLSVLVLGIDAVSRLNFHRTMPKTASALQRLGAIEMLGYNKVGDNTFPNLVPVLTGLSEEELTKEYWLSTKDTFDASPFVWKNFSQAGYRTIFAEDACHMGIFNYLKSGFKNPPTDYYLRPYCIAAEQNIGNTHKLNADLCVGTRKTFDNLLSYCDKVAREFVDDPYFAFFWQASLTHDFVTYGQLGDASYEEFLLRLSKDKLIDNVALVVMSDHGIRWGSFRQTYQGRVEESLPFVFLLLPEWWRQEHQGAWANLRSNTNSLTTPFDLHETLLDLLKSEELIETELQQRTKALSAETIPRGLSWFLPVPDYRTCSMAGISGHWCMCHSSQNVSIDDPMASRAVDFLLDHLNNMIASYPQCSELKLSKIVSAKIWDNRSQAKDKEPPMIDCTVTIQTKPGGAVFEATIRHYKNVDQLVGSISRLNLYGKQSVCVDDFKMRLYCYCR